MGWEDNFSCLATIWMIWNEFWLIKTGLVVELNGKKQTKTTFLELDCSLSYWVNGFTAFLGVKNGRKWCDRIIFLCPATNWQYSLLGCGVLQWKLSNKLMFFFQILMSCHTLIFPLLARSFLGKQILTFVSAPVPAPNLVPTGD